MDIRAGIIAAIVLSLIGAMLILRAGLRALRSARRLTFYRIRRQRERGGGRAHPLSLPGLWFRASLVHDGSAMWFIRKRSRGTAKLADSDSPSGRHRPKSGYPAHTKYRSAWGSNGKWWDSSSFKATHRHRYRPLLLPPRLHPRGQ